MSDKPIVLDLFCCAGGATRGFQRAGFQVYGVDNKSRPNYCGDDFILSDALVLLREFIGQSLLGYGKRVKLIHTSPPCQKGNALTIGTNASRGWGAQADVVQIIPELRELLLATGIPFIIEQPQSERDLIRQDLMLCGDMFRAGPPPYVQRHRYFEIEGFSVPQPKHVKHDGRVRGWRHGVYHDGPYVAAYGDGGGKATVPEMKHALGIDWTDEREELTEAIPPSYTEYIGKWFLRNNR